MHTSRCDENLLPIKLVDRMIQHAKRCPIAGPIRTLMIPATDDTPSRIIDAHHPECGWRALQAEVEDWLR